MYRHFHLNKACSQAFAQDKIVSASKSAFINQKVELLFLKKTLITTSFIPSFFCPAHNVMKSTIDSTPTLFFPPIPSMTVVRANLSITTL